MPQLDKVTFLSQFFWFCVVFFSMYLILVKLFLPSLARIVKVRQALAAAGSSESTETVGATTVPTEKSDIYSNSLQASVEAFQAHSNFLSRWSSTRLKTVVRDISPKFEDALIAIRSESLLAENLLDEVVPPVGCQEDLVFGDSNHKSWYTATLMKRLFPKKTVKGKGKKKKATTGKASVKSVQPVISGNNVTKIVRKRVASAESVAAQVSEKKELSNKNKSRKSKKD